MWINAKTAGGALLVSGTAIGAGMLALPITTGIGGFEGALGVFVVSMLFMNLNLFILLEASEYTEKRDANIISMAGTHLGMWAQAVAWLAFLLLLYAAAAAYISGAGSLVAHWLSGLLSYSVPTVVGVCLCVCIFSLIVSGGIRTVDLLNRVCMVGLIVSYVLLLCMVLPHVTVQALEGGHPRYLWSSIPVVVLSFTSHIVLPSLRDYFGEDKRGLRQALFWGSLLPFFVYVLWECSVVGVLPFTGEHGLLAIASSPEPVAGLTRALESHFHLPWAGLNMGFFSFFALITSFLGVALSLRDFLADGLGIQKKGWRNRSVILALTFLPPLFFAVLFPHGFVTALSYAGVFVAILYGILPACMVWKARYVRQQQASYRCPGGRGTLLLMPLLSFVIIGLQVASTLHWLPVPGQ